MGVSLGRPSVHRSAAPSSISGSRSLCCRGRSPASIRRSRTGRNKRQPSRSNRLERYNAVSMFAALRGAASCDRVGDVRGWILRRWRRQSRSAGDHLRRRLRGPEDDAQSRKCALRAAKLEFPLHGGASARETLPRTGQSGTTRSGNGKWGSHLRCHRACRLAPGRPALQQPQVPEARMALAADHQVVVDGDAKRLGGRPDLARHLDVVA